MQAAGKNLTRVNLELGGKAPAIVLADADLDLAAKAIYDSRMVNTGQLCNCAERVYVQKSVAGPLVERLSKLMRATRYGDPIKDPNLDMGPLINRASLDKITAMVDRARADGAEVVTGGKPANLGQGFHYEPTVLANCRADMEIMRREIFGPVLPVQAVDNLDEAIELANDSEYGLTSSVFTKDLNSRAARGPRSAVWRDLCQSRTLRGDAGVPRRSTQVRHWRSRRQAWPLRIYGDACRLYSAIVKEAAARQRQCPLGSFNRNVLSTEASRGSP